LCSGAIAGLVAATPSSGYINPHAGIACGVIAAGICNYATKLKFVFGIDDSMDIFAVHGLAGMIGLFINGIFGVNYVPALDGLTLGASTIPGGWFNHHWIQLGYQVAYICVTSAYSFVVTGIILFVMNIIPWFRLRVPHDAEVEGIDETELGEFAFDFVEIRRDFNSWNAPDPNVIEGRVREELENQQEKLGKDGALSGGTPYSSANKKPEDEERTEQAVKEGEALYPQVLEAEGST
jgi:ammonium transporter, Amt family